MRSMKFNKKLKIVLSIIVALVVLVFIANFIRLKPWENHRYHVRLRQIATLFDLREGRILSSIENCGNLFTPPVTHVTREGNIYINDGMGNYCIIAPVGEYFLIASPGLDNKWASGIVSEFDYISIFASEKSTAGQNTEDDIIIIAHPKEYDKDTGCISVKNDVYVHINFDEYAEWRVPFWKLWD